MKKLDFEQKIEKSKEILEALMDPEITLEKSVKLYKEGMRELAEATKLLEEAKLEFERYQPLSTEEEDSLS